MKTGSKILPPANTMDTKDKDVEKAKKNKALKELDSIDINDDIFEMVTKKIKLTLIFKLILFLFISICLFLLLTILKVIK